MDLRILGEAVTRGLTQRQIAAELGVSQATVKYWLSKAEIKTKRALLEKPTCCVLCGSGLGENYKHRTRCSGCNTKVRRIRTKIAGIRYLGGKCTHCGYDNLRNYAAFDFHHYKGDKDFGITQYITEHGVQSGRS